MGRVLQIGTAARRTGLSIDAIRFYQKSGLLKPPARTAAGYRVFTEAEIAELQFIARAQDLGFSLAEIKELVPLRNEDGRACPEVRSLIRRKLQNVREKIAALTELETELSRAIRTCDRALRAHASVPGGCPVIEQIAAGKTRRKS
jgi:MerR family mercuric resistance operon transcriptional regulator